MSGRRIVVVVVLALALSSCAFFAAGDELWRNVGLVLVGASGGVLLGLCLAEMPVAADSRRRPARPTVPRPEGIEGEEVSVQPRPFFGLRKAHEPRRDWSEPDLFPQPHRMTADEKKEAVEAELAGKMCHTTAVEAAFDKGADGIQALQRVTEYGLE